MSLKFDVVELAEEYDKLCSTMGGYVQPGDLEMVLKPRDVRELFDLTEDTDEERWYLTIQCKICLESVSSYVPDMYHVTCGTCNAGLCVVCYDRLLNPLKAVTYKYRDEFKRWMIPMMKCPFCSTCLVERRWLIRNCLVKTLEASEEDRVHLEARMYRLYLVNLTLENPLLDFADVVSEDEYESE